MNFPAQMTTWIARSALTAAAMVVLATPATLQAASQPVPDAFDRYVQNNAPSTSVSDAFDRYLQNKPEPSAIERLVLQEQTRMRVALPMHPDSRANRFTPTSGVGQPALVAVGDAFDWSDAGVGIGTGLGIALLALAINRALRRQSPAHGQAGLSRS